MSLRNFIKNDKHPDLHRDFGTMTGSPMLKLSLVFIKIPYLFYTVNHFFTNFIFIQSNFNSSVNNIAVKKI